MVAVHHQKEKNHHKNWFKHHKKNQKDLMKKGYDINVDEMTEDQALAQADMIVCFCVFFVAIWSLVWYLVFQGLFIMGIKKAMSAQSALENYFMGQEVQARSSGVPIPQFVVP
jgi:hypothetical protein